MTVKKNLKKYFTALRLSANLLPVLLIRSAVASNAGVNLEFNVNTATICGGGFAADINEAFEGSRKEFFIKLVKIRTGYLSDD